MWSEISIERVDDIGNFETFGSFDGLVKINPKVTKDLFPVCIATGD